MKKANKIKKHRKPMSPEQKVAAVERLALAREKRLKENPPEYKNISQEVQSLPDDHPLTMANVKGWIKISQEKIASLKVAVRQKVKGADAKLADHEGYIRNMQKYLRDGVWVDMFYGEQQQGKIRNRCVAMAYYWYGPRKGQPKRDVGTFYPDLGLVWTQEMLEEEYGNERPRDDATGERDKGPVARKKRKRSKTS